MKANVKQRKKSQKQVTLFVIPGLTDKPRNFTLQRNTLWRTGILLGCLALMFLSIGIFYFSGLDGVRFVKSIEKDNKNKDQTIQQLKKEIKNLNAQQQEIDNKQNEIRRLMGLPEQKVNSTSALQGGQGGKDRELAKGEDSETVQIAQQIQTNLDKRDKELDSMLAAVRKDQAYYRAVPNQWPVTGKISSEYGLRKSPMGGRSEAFHEGIDIANKVGTAILASADGTVTFSGVQAIYGRTVIINHGYGLETKYGHNAQLLVKKGDRVKKGDVIARLGNTGRSTGPHLHFSLFKNKKLVDPTVYLPQLNNAMS